MIISEERLKDLAAAVVTVAIEDYRDGDRKTREKIRSDMANNTIWMDLLDVEMSFDQVADILEDQESRGVKIAKFSWCF